MSTTTLESSSDIAAVSHHGAGFLTFRLGKEEYGIDILQVQEIRSYEEPTRMVQAPAFIKGVINLRGTIVSIVDLRIKLGCADVQYTDFTVVIFLNVEGHMLGVVVDAVADVVQLGEEQIKPAPHFEGQIDAAFVRSIASMGERMLIVARIDALLSPSDRHAVQSAEAEMC